MKSVVNTSLVIQNKITEIWNRSKNFIKKAELAASDKAINGTKNKSKTVWGVINIIRLKKQELLPLT